MITENTPSQWKNNYNNSFIHLLTRHSNEQTKHKLTNTENRFMFTRGEGEWGWVKCIKEVNSVVMNGN